MWQNIVRMSICIYKNDNKKLEEGSEKEKQRKKNNYIINYAIGQFISFNNRIKNVFTFNNFLVQCLLNADHVYENNIHSAITSIAKLPFFHYSDDKEKIRFIYDVEKSLTNLFFKKFKESIGKYIYDNIEYVFDAKCVHHIPFRARFIFENSLIDYLRISQKSNQEIIRILDSLFKKTARNKNSDENDVKVLSFMFLIHRLLPVIFWDDQNVDNLNSGNIKNKIISTGLLTKLFERIKYGQEELPYYICFSLAGIGNPLFTNYFYKLFVEELDNRNPFVRQACAEAIGKLGIVEGIDRLVSHLKTDPDGTIRMACAEALGNIEMASRSDVADALISKINDNDKCVGLACIKSLGRLKEKKAITPLLKAIKLEYTKKACIEAFGKLRAKKAISSITKSLNSTNPEIRRASAEALGKLRPSDEKAYRSLRKRLNDKIFTVRLACAEALAKLRKIPPNVLKSYLLDLNDKDSPKHMESIMMLEKFNSIDVLEQVLQQHDDPFVRAACAESLGRLNASKAVGTLIDCLKDPYSSVCCESARSLGRLKATQSIPSLILSLDDIDLQVKIACARSLGKLQAKEAIPKFMEHLKTNNTQLCSIIVEALIIIDCSQNELQVAVDEDDQFWFVVLRKIIKLAPKKLKGKYRFLIQEFMPEDKWGQMKVEERERRRAVKKRRLDMLKEMMHSEVWEDREKAADVLNNILIAVSTKEEVLLRE